MPFKRDLSDLEEKILWARRHEKEVSIKLRFNIMIILQQLFWITLCILLSARFEVMFEQFFPSSMNIFLSLFLSVIKC